MKIISYNVNGIRSAMSKDLISWLRAADADIVCFQEIKASPEQLDLSIFESLGYHHYWYPAVKKGYSGVAILSRQKPDHIEYGLGMPAYDEEGRALRIDIGDLSVMSLYIPSGTSGDLRQDVKMKFLEDFKAYVLKLKSQRPNLVISGDYNICHTSIDIHNPVSNANSTGFLPEEREWISRFLEAGFTDSFRFLNKDPHHYTWWSFRAGARSRNLGWRIDYQMVTDPLKDRILRANILPEAKHSDHCPTMLELRM